MPAFDDGHPDVPSDHDTSDCMLYRVMTQVMEMAGTVADDYTDAHFHVTVPLLRRLDSMLLLHGLLRLNVCPRIAGLDDDLAQRRAPVVLRQALAVLDEEDARRFAVYALRCHVCRAAYRGTAMDPLYADLPFIYNLPDIPFPRDLSGDDGDTPGVN